MEKTAVLGLDEALERARLLADDSLYLNEQSYELLVDKIDEEDLYPFTMGLVERGIVVKNATQRTAQSVEEKLVKAAQSFTQQTPAGLWVPENYEDLDGDPDEPPEDSDYESFLESTPFVWPHDNPEVDISSLRDTLENAGIRITPEGTVEMYQAHIPGIYTDKLPQGPLPLDIAVKYFDQLLDSTDIEQGKLDGLLDLLTRLDNQTGGLQQSISELDAYKFSPASRSESSQAISGGLDELRRLISEGNWNGAQRATESLVGTVEDYAGDRYGAYDESLAVLDALDRLADLQAEDPATYQKAIEGLGGMPLAAARRG